MKLNWKKYLGLVLLPLLIISGCGDVDDVTDCTYYLNQKKYDRVANDTSCSTYERASAYMGLAGFRFSNFLASDASENFRQALGIPASVTSWTNWSGKSQYEAAMQLTGDATGDTYEGQSRALEDVEIHYFASLAALMALTYIEMDADSDGEVSEDEIQGFTSIRSSDDANYGRNEIAGAEWIEFVTDKGTASEEVYLLNLAAGTCIRQTAAPYYDGLWDSTSYPITNTNPAQCGLLDVPTMTSWVIPGEGAITGTCAVVMKIEDLQSLFDSSSSGGSISVVDLTENFVNYINAIDSDMVQLGLDEDSDLRQQLNDFSANIDNGGDCGSDTLTEVNQIYTILEVAAENAAADYENVNVLSFDDISSASDTAVAVTSFSTVIEYALTPITVTISCSNAANLSARMIYKDLAGTDYVPYYSGASSNIKDTFTALKDLNTDSNGNVKPTVAGDGIIAIKELVCME